MTLYTVAIHVSIGSVGVTAYDFESGRLGSNPEWGQYTIRLRSLQRAYPSLHPFGVVHWVSEQLNIKAVTGACKLIDGCRAVFGHNFCGIISSGIAKEIKSIQLHDSILMALPWDSISYIHTHTYIQLGQYSTHEINNYLSISIRVHFKFDQNTDRVEVYQKNE